MNLKPALWLKDQIIKVCVLTKKVKVRKIVLATVVTASVVLAGLLTPPVQIQETAEDAEPPSTELTQHEPTAEELEQKRITEEHIKANDQSIVTQKPAYEPIDTEYYNYLAEKYAEKYGANIAWLKRVRFCESRDNHLNDNNPKCKGLYQFMPSTFYANAKRIGLENPDLWSADNQTEVAAYMQSIGQQGQWTCK